MKKALIIVLMSPTLLTAQWTERIVTTDAESTIQMVAARINNDSDMDVLGLNNFPAQDFTWYENLDGAGNFGSVNSIGVLDEPRYMEVGDIDGDGDMDVLGSTPFDPPNVVWYENTNNDGLFGSANIIDTPLTEGEVFMQLADIDGDDDNDLVMSGTDLNLVWYENLDGNGSFGAPQIIISNFVSSRVISVVDIDNDDDMDICVGTTASGLMAWFENLNGNGNFSSPREFGLMSQGIIAIATADIDGDNDIDIVGASNQSKLVWWENLDGLGDFGDDILIESFSASDLFVGDLDNDEDIDILSVVSLNDGSISWHENLDGLGNFSKGQFIDNLPFPTTVTAADLDNDGDLDPITASQTEDTIVWYENDLLSNNTEEAIAFNIYPNPAEDLLRVKGKTHDAINKISLYTATGILVKDIYIDVAYIDVKQLATGVYFLHIQTHQATSVLKFVKN